MLEKLFTDIEAAKTAALVNVVSGWRSFVRALVQLDAVRELATEARSNETVASHVLMRLVGLSQLKVDPRYENPNDVAMAAYLQVLSLTAPELYASAIDAVLSAQNCWWATQLAQAGRSQHEATGDETLVATEIVSILGEPTVWLHDDWVTVSCVTGETSAEMVVASGAAFSDSGYTLIMVPSDVDVRPSSAVGTVKGQEDEGQVLRWVHENSPTGNSRLAVAA